MKRTFFLVLSLAVSIIVHGQSTTYTRELVRIGYRDAIQLVANVSGQHHLLVLPPRKQAFLYIYNPALQLQLKKELPVTVPENCDVKIHQLANYYYVYMQVQANKQYWFLQIDAQGNVKDFTERFCEMLQLQLNQKVTATHIIVSGGYLYITANRFNPAARIMMTTLIKTDRDLQIVSAHAVKYEFKKGEVLSQVKLLNGQCLLVLKAGTQVEKGNVLELMKFDLKNDSIVSTVYSSGSNLILHPDVQYNATDSTVLLYAMIKEPPQAVAIQRRAFVVRLDHLLNPLSPVALYKTTGKNEVPTNFILVNGSAPAWLHLYDAYIGYGLSVTRNLMPDRYYSDNPRGFAFGRAQTPTSFFSGSTYTGYPEIPGSVRFMLLDEQLRVVTDSLVANDKRKYKIDLRPFAKFNYNSNSYLILKQHFRAKAQGLLMLFIDQQQLAATDIRVYDKYDYQLAQFQQIRPGAFIIPFIHKREVGLMQVDMDRQRY